MYQPLLLLYIRSSSTRHKTYALHKPFVHHKKVRLPNKFQINERSFPPVVHFIFVVNYYLFFQLNVFFISRKQSFHVDSTFNSHKNCLHKKSFTSKMKAGQIFRCRFMYIATTRVTMQHIKTTTVRTPHSLRV